MIFIIGLLLGIFTGAFIANSSFRGKVIARTKKLIKKA
jgi:hypothetical protein